MLVSAVIPTLARPECVVRAVQSALAQSYAPLEVIVVVDGPDEATQQSLGKIFDPRLKVIALRENAGGAEARNIGVRAASGEWIAFLDDDDEWLPPKLERQMRTVLESSVKYPVISSRLIAERILPRRIYRPGGDISEYLFCRRSFCYGEGMLQTSTLLAKRELLLEVPFQKDLKRHQDWDWLLRVAGRSDVEMRMLPDALTRMTAQTGASVSTSGDWRISLEWARSRREQMSAKAYSFFITTECVTRARKARVGHRVILELLAECFRRGDATFRQMLLFLLFCAKPVEKRSPETKTIEMAV